MTAPMLDVAAPALLLSDVDDTITWHGELPVEALSAMHALREADVDLVLVTGACAGWCDQMARTWPVSAVIGENGAFTIERLGRRLVYVDTQDDATRRANQARLLDAAREIRRELPSLRASGDQPYRRYDVALDHAQDVVPAPPLDAQRAAQRFRELGAQATISSIHVNAWIGEFSKLASARAFLERSRGWSTEAMREHCAFIGDSLNDHEMFRFFPRSAGVANVERCLDRLEVPPARIMSRPGGQGFAEFVRLALRPDRP
jgi:HAD superfamily hydrolase (TIGR01484 family)